MLFHLRQIVILTLKWKMKHAWLPFNKHDLHSYKIILKASYTKGQWSLISFSEKLQNFQLYWQQITKTVALVVNLNMFHMNNFFSIIFLQHNIIVCSSFLKICSSITVQDKDWIIKYLSIIQLSYCSMQPLEWHDKKPSKIIWTLKEDKIHFS